MNGVRRFLAGSSSPTTPPSSSSTYTPSKPSAGSTGWAPQIPNGHGADSTESVSPALASAPASVWRHNAKPSSSSSGRGDDSLQRSNGATSSSSFSMGSKQQVNGRSKSHFDPTSPSKYLPFSPLSPDLDRKSAQTPPITRDDLLISLLTSEAVIDSREFEILSSEEIEDLKTEYNTLSLKLTAMTKKLGLETKMRDASRSLARVNGVKVPIKGADDPLEIANRKVEATERELWRIKEQGNSIQRRLLEHRAGVLGLSVRTLEKRLGGDETTDTGHGSGSSSPDRSLVRSPTVSSSTSVSTGSRAYKNRFDGPHLFAGHADAVTPKSARGPVSSMEVTQLEERLKRALSEVEALKQQNVQLINDLEDSDAQRAQENLALSRAREDLESAASGLRAHGIGSPNSTLSGLIAEAGASIKSGSGTTDRHSSEEEWEAERQMLIEEKDAAQKEILVLESFIKGQQEASPVAAYAGDSTKFVQILQPVWAMLPSPELRANKLGARRPTAGSPIPNSPSTPASSLADLDIKQLKTLYDMRHTPSLPSTPSSLAHQLFTVEAFADRVRALLADDRALVDRLLRFAHAHDLLRKNAERAQKLAQDSGVGLETYQKQVRALEQSIADLESHNHAIGDETHELKEQIQRLVEAKDDVELQLNKQHANVRQLQETNNTLSTKTLHLAQEVNTLSGTRKQLETAESALGMLQEELDQIRNAEATQQSALMDELNLLQKDNQNLRAQIRAKK